MSKKRLPVFKNVFPSIPIPALAQKHYSNEGQIISESRAKCQTFDHTFLQPCQGFLLNPAIVVLC